jgi:light-harvesting complex 1 beta chain
MGAPPVNTSLSGLSDDEARSFHRVFITSFLAFTLIAAAAHYAVWQWRPWIPGVQGYPAATASAPALTPSATVVASTP